MKKCVRVAVDMTGLCSAVRLYGLAPGMHSLNEYRQGMATLSQGIIDDVMAFCSPCDGGINMASDNLAAVMGECSKRFPVKVKNHRDYLKQVTKEVAA